MIKAVTVDDYEEEGTVDSAFLFGDDKIVLKLIFAWFW